MPEVDKLIFGIHDRRDGPGGHIEVTPTTMGYVEGGWLGYSGRKSAGI